MIYLNGLKSGLNSISRFCIICCSIFILVINNNEVKAVTFDTAFMQTVERSSNILHKNEVIDDGLSEETISTSSLILKLVDNFTRAKAKFDLKLSYLDYENNLIRDTEKNSLNTEVTWSIKRGFYSWYLKDTYTQSSIDKLSISDEINQQDVNKLLTGPRFEWRFGTGLVNFDTSVAHYDYSETNNNNSSLLTNLKVGKKMSSGVVLSLDYAAKIVSYESESSQNDFDRQSLGVSISYDRKINKVNAFIGSSVLDIEGSKQERAEDTRLSYKRIMSKSSYMTLAYSNKISDENDVIESDRTTLSGVFTVEKSSFEYHRSSGESKLSLKYKKKNTDSSISDDSDTSTISEVSLTRNISAKSRVSLSYSDKYNEIDTSTSDILENKYKKSLEFIKLFNNKLTMKIKLSGLTNVSSDMLRQYKDNRVSITLSFSR